MSEIKQPDNSYLNERLQELSITPEVYKLEFPLFKKWEEGRAVFEETTKREFNYFEATEEGNIRINYPNLQFSHYNWTKDGNKWPINFYRERLKVPKEYLNDGKKDVQKYHQPKGSGQNPFITPSILWKYQEGTQIENLVVIEGEFKAFKAYSDAHMDKNEKIDFLGIPSIHGFYGGDPAVKRSIHPDIVKIIEVCKVKNIIYLTDADTLQVTWSEGKDLYKRQATFNAAIKFFREALDKYINSKECELNTVYFMHLKTELCKDDAKGLDDLLVKRPAVRGAIFNDLLKCSFASEFFAGENITDPQFYGRMNKYFGLGSVDDFYSIYKEYIGNREFVFRKVNYQFNGEKVEYLRHADTDKYMRIGIDWVKIVKIPNKHGIPEEKVVKWSISEIKRDYPKHQSDQLVKDIPRYDTYAVEPNWNGQYKRLVHECYNLMNPMVHEPKAGMIETSLKFMHHIFRGEGKITYNEETKQYEEHAVEGDLFTVAMDYLTIIHQHPKQMMPVPCLVSPENGTGKSTFLKWLSMIYAGNAVILNNDRFKMNFNGHYAGKFIIGLDEGFLEVEKKAEKEKLKQLVTSDTIFLENKGMDIKEIPYYGKLIICSNDADRLMKIDEGETRWFIVRVYPSETKDPFMEDKLKDEIPAWIDFIGKRKIFHPKKDRLWFLPKHFETDQFRKIVEVTKNRLEAVIEEFIKDMFLTYKESPLRLPPKAILERVNDPKFSKYKIDEKDLRYYLQEKKKMTPADKPQRVNIPISLIGQDEFGTLTEPKTIYDKGVMCRPYVFRMEDWLTEAEVELMNTPWGTDWDKALEDEEEKIAKTETKQKELPF